MYLQLAERRKGKVKVSSYKRSSSVASHKRRYPLNDNGDIDNPYIFFPNFESGGGVYVREDKFDNLPDTQWATFMKNIAPYQPEIQRQTLSEPMFLASRAERKAKRKQKQDERKAKKTERAELRTEKKEARVIAKQDRNTRRNDRVAGRQQRAEDRADARDERIDNRAQKRADGGGFDFDRVKEFGSGLIDRFTGGGGGGGEQDFDDYEEETPFYKNPLFIGGAILVGGVIAYAMTRPKTAEPSMLPL